MDRLAEMLGTGVGYTVTWLVDNGILFGIFGLAWVAIGVALVRRKGTVDRAWAWLRSLPIVARAAVWLLFLPVMIGLWIWESTWPLIIRATLLLAIAAWNLMIFLPRAVQAPA